MPDLVGYGYRRIPLVHGDAQLRIVRHVLIQTPDTHTQDENTSRRIAFLGTNIKVRTVKQHVWRKEKVCSTRPNIHRVARRRDSLSLDIAQSIYALVYIFYHPLVNTHEDIHILSIPNHRTIIEGLCNAMFPKDGFVQGLLHRVGFIGIIIDTYHRFGQIDIRHHALHFLLREDAGRSFAARPT